MKKGLLKLMAFSSIVLLMMASCKKDGALTVAKTGTPGTLTASANDIVLSSENASATAVTFSFTPSTYGYDAAVKYTLQLDIKGDNFASSKDISLTAGTTSKAYLGSDFNTVLLAMGLVAGNSTQIETRIKSELATGVKTVYSNVISLTVTPYFDIPVYPSLYAPGAYQGWSPSTAERVSSANDNKVYEGYINFPDAASLEFKLTSDPDWSHTNYGDGGSGKLSTDGGAGNLKVPSTGYYQVIADLNANVWTVTKTDWGIIGDATPGGWDSSTALTYNTTTKVWEGTIHLTGGLSAKFRANNAWDINLGDNSPANGVLKYGGENISIAETGDYKVILNLSNPAFYYYSITKQ